MYCKCLSYFVCKHGETSGPQVWSLYRTPSPHTLHRTHTPLSTVRQLKALQWWTECVALNCRFRAQLTKAPLTYQIAEHRTLLDVIVNMVCLGNALPNVIFVFSEKELEHSDIEYI